MQAIKQRGGKGQNLGTAIAIRPGLEYVWARSLRSLLTEANKEWFGTGYFSSRADYGPSRREAGQLVYGHSTAFGNLALWACADSPGASMVVRPKFLAWIFRADLFCLHYLAKSHPPAGNTTEALHMGIAFHYDRAGDAASRNIRRRALPFSSVTYSAHCRRSRIFRRMGDVSGCSVSNMFPGVNGPHSGDCVQSDHFAIANTGLKTGSWNASNLWSASSSRGQHH